MLHLRQSFEFSGYARSAVPWSKSGRSLGLSLTEPSSQELEAMLVFEDDETEEDLNAKIDNEDERDRETARVYVL